MGHHVIVVTGSMRSGTSAWMGALHAAGFPVIGDQHPPMFRHLRELNREGFWESTLRHGITPLAAKSMHPLLYAAHAVKIFAAGVRRTPVEFLGRVIFTVREPREYLASRARFFALEGNGRARELPDFVAEWWSCNHGMLADMLQRRYPVRVWTYADLVADPERVVGSTLAWLGRARQAAPALATVQACHQTQVRADWPASVDAETRTHLEALYACLQSGRIDRDGARQFDRATDFLRPRLIAEGERVRAELDRQKERRAAKRVQTSATGGG